MKTFLCLFAACVGLQVSAQIISGTSISVSTNFVLQGRSTNFFAVNTNQLGAVTLLSNYGIAYNAELLGNTVMEIVYTDQISSDAFIAGYDGVAAPNNYNMPKSWITARATAIECYITNLTALPVLSTVTTGSDTNGVPRDAIVLEGDWAGLWVYCPLSLDDTNGANIRYPDSTTANTTQGRWEFVTSSKTTKTVATIAELESLDPRELASEFVGTNTTFEATVFVSEEYRGGMFRWISGSAATNGVGSMYIDANGGQWARVWDNTQVLASWFGAIPGDNTGDSSEIQSAIDFMTYNTTPDGVPIGGTVKFPDGVYEIDATVTNRLRVNMVGADVVRFSDVESYLQYSTNSLYYGPVKFLAVTNLNAHMVQVDHEDPRQLTRQDPDCQEDGTCTNSVLAQMGFKGIVFDGNGFNQTNDIAAAISAKYAWDIEIDNCGFHNNPGPAIEIWDCNGVNIHGCHAVSQYGGRRNNFLVYGSADVIINRNFIFGGDGPRIWLLGTSASKNLITVNIIGNAGIAQYPITSVASDILTLSSNHNYSTGSILEPFSTNGSWGIPSGLTQRAYWAIYVDTNRVALATNEYAAFAGIKVPISAIGTNAWLWSGAPSGIYASWGPNANVILGNRVDQNSWSGITLNAAMDSTIVANVSGENGYDTPTGLPTTYSAAGVDIIEGLGTINISGNVFKLGYQQYGLRLWPNVATSTGRKIVLGQNAYDVVSPLINDYSTGNSYVEHAVVDLAGVSAIRGALIVTNGITMGETNTAYSLYLKGGVGGIPLVKLERAGFDIAGIRYSSGGAVAGEAGIQFANETSSRFIAQFRENSTSVTHIAGGANSTARTFHSYADLGSGTDVSGGTRNYYTPLGTGAGSTASAIHQFLVPVAGSSGTTQQSTETALRVDGSDSTTQTGIVVLRNGTQVRVEFGANDSGGAGYQMLRVLNP